MLIPTFHWRAWATRDVTIVLLLTAFWSMSAIGCVFVPQWRNTLFHVGVAGLVCSTVVGAVMVRIHMRRAERSELKFQNVLEAAPDAIVITNRLGRIILANQQALMMFGYRREELLKKRLESLVTRSRHAAEPAGFSLYTTRRAESSPEYVGRNSNGVSFCVDFTFKILETVDEFQIVYSLRDTTEQKIAEGQRATRSAVRRVLLEKDSLAEAAPQALQALCEGMSLELGILWVVDTSSSPTFLRSYALWQSPLLASPELRSLGTDWTFGSGIGVPGQIWKSRKAHWIADLTTDGDETRRNTIVRAGLRNSVCFPLLGDAVVGVVELFGRTPRTPDERFWETLAVIGAQIGRFVEQKRAERALRDSEARKRAILEGCLDAVVIADIDGRIVEANSTFSDMFCCPSDQATSLSFFQFLVLPAETDSTNPRELVSCFPTEQRLELTARRWDGSEFPIEATFTHVRLEKEELCVAYLRDRSEQQQEARATAERAVAGASCSSLACASGERTLACASGERACNA